MRVIAGKARRLQLRTPEGYQVRPTADRIKETLFNILNPYLADANFLDIFSGSGAIGIEALSRGAGYAAFVENAGDSLECIRHNLKHTGLDKQAEVFAQDAVAAIHGFELREKVFDIIFMDPPYDKELERQVLMRLDNSSILSPDTIVVVEASNNTNFDYLENTGFQILRKKEYKTNQHIFLELRQIDRE